MSVPIRCFTCNKVIGHLWDEYENKVQKAFLEEDIANKPKKRFIPLSDLDKKAIEGKILDELGLNKYCCRRMLLSNVDITKYL